MKTELCYLAAVTAFTGLLWVPYILNRLAVRGLLDAVGYPDNPKPQSAWAQRLMKAHANAVENLVVFATLILLAHVLGLTSSAIATAAVVYFWARVVHAVAYTFAVPWVRTLAFTAGFLAQAVIAWQILAVRAS
ncbi:MAG: MAPEG family protein [Steroidobacteraceae bacterium]